MWQRCENRRSLNRTPWETSVVECGQHDFPADFVKRCKGKGIFVNGVRTQNL